MRQLLLVKEYVLTIYQKHTLLLQSLFRWLLGFLTFFSIERMIGYRPVFNHIFVELLLGSLAVFLPMEVLLFTSLLLIASNIYYVSHVLGISVGMILLIVYLIYIQFVPKHGFVILAVPITFGLGVSYGVPVILGLCFSPMVIFPMWIGIGIYFLFQTVVSVVATASDDTVNLFQVMIDQFMDNQQMYATLLIFSLVLLMVYFLRKLSFDYSFEIALLAGMFTNMILFLIANFSSIVTLKMLPFFVGIIASTAIAWFVQFMRFSLNYAAVERLQFEDEEYYYYVRAVPKMSMSAQRKKVKRFNAHLFGDSLQPHMPGDSTTIDHQKEGGNT